MVEIRPLAKEELSLLRHLAIESYRQTFEASNTTENMEAFIRRTYSQDAVEREWAEPGSVCYLAWEGNTAVGFVRLRLCDEVANQLGTNTIELQRLYVHPGHQGRQVGSGLMSVAVEYAKLHQFDWIWLGVWERNFKAQDFYSRWGFERFGEHIFQMGDDPQIDWLLKKKLK